MQFTCSIKQIKGHLKEYVSPSKASNNCLIQFSPATYKQGQICSTHMFKYVQLPKTWLTFPHKEIYAHTKCGNTCRWLSTQNIVAHVLVMHFPSIPLQHCTCSTEHPDPNKLTCSLRYCKHFQGEICIHAGINLYCKAPSG